MSKLQTFGEGLSCNVHVEHARIAGLVDAEWIRAWPVPTAALSEIEGTVDEAI